MCYAEIWEGVSLFSSWEGRQETELRDPKPSMQKKATVALQFCSFGAWSERRDICYIYTYLYIACEKAVYI